MCCSSMESDVSSTEWNKVLDDYYAAIIERGRTRVIDGDFITTPVPITIKDIFMPREDC